MPGYRDLGVWQRAIRLALLVYKLTRAFPGDERFGLTSQMRRAAVSVASNIAEGQGRNTRQETIRFCRIAMGSIAELETQLTISKELGFGDQQICQDILALSDEISRMLQGLIRSARLAG